MSLLRPILQTLPLIFSESTAFLILQFLQYTGLVQLIHQTKPGPSWSYFRFFSENWKNRPKIFCSERKIAFFVCLFLQLYFVLKQPVRDTGKQLAFKMIIFSRDKLTFSTKPHTFLLGWGCWESFYNCVFLTLRWWKIKKRDQGWH